MAFKDTCPLSRMDACIHTIGDAQYLTTLDAYSWSWQMNIDKKERPNPAFLFYEGTFQCVWRLLRLMDERTF